MSPSSPPPNLAALDAEQPVPLDPRVWQANRAALAEQQPDVAAALDRTALPAAWRAARALDGCVAWRTEPPGHPPAWLGDTAVPARRAQTLMQHTAIATTNYLLPAAATGAELPALLAHLPPSLAVFLCEPDPVRLAALLRVHDVSAALRAGRCVLVPPDRPQEFLRDYLRAHPGVLPPLRIALPDLANAAHVERLARLCRHVNDTITAERAQRRASLRISPPPADAATPRLAILVLVHRAASARHAEPLEHAARSLGWDVQRRGIERPADMDALVHAEVLAAFSPHFVLCVDHLPSHLTVPISAPAFAWFTDVSTVPAGVPPDGARYLAATPEVRSRLHAAGAADAALWAFGADVRETCDERNRGAAGAECEIAADDVVLIGDRPDVAPAAVGLDQETHAKLWDTLLRVVEAHWQSPRVLHAGRLLREAEQRCDIALHEAELRGGVERLVAEVAVPSVVLAQVARALTAAGLRVHTVETGWQPRTFADAASPSSSSRDPTPDAPRRPLACIAADPIRLLSPALLGAAARGWPLVLHRLGRRAIGPALADVLELQHYESFTDTRELIGLLESMRKHSGPAEARAARTRRHVCEAHSTAHRLAELRARVGGASPEPR